MNARTPIALLVAITVVAGPATTAAQIEENLEAYTETNAAGYLEPLRDTLSSGLGAGTFSSADIARARPYFRIGARLMIVGFSDEDRTFDASAEDYFPGTGSFEAPTVIGDENPDPVDGPGGTSFQFPGGLDLDRLPVAAPQLTVGGFMGTEAMLRWFDGDFGDADIGSVSLFGFGLRHSISQYVPASPVALAGSFTYQTFTIGDDLVDFSQTSFGVQASKRFPIVEPYAGLALHRSSMEAEYEFTGGGASETIQVDFEDQTSVQLAVGATLHLTLLKLSAEIAFGDQTTYSLGLGLGI